MIKITPRRSVNNIYSLYSSGVLMMFLWVGMHSQGGKLMIRQNIGYFTFTGDNEKRGRRKTRILIPFSKLNEFHKLHTTRGIYFMLIWQRGKDEIYSQVGEGCQPVPLTPSAEIAPVSVLNGNPLLIQIYNSTSLHFITNLGTFTRFD